ncbi:MAG: hypothetical protein KME14_11065 [Tildeniella torsiva UHER 1998/13D]|jgi:hypothetical protein|nr:hypothetical protein [Tildeniella torsiva UHER 1998/13D]
MTTLLDQAFQAAQKLPSDLQDELAQQWLDDIQNELRWQETLSVSDMESDILTSMALAALAEDDAVVTAIDEGKTSEPVSREAIFEILEFGGAECNSLN